MTMALHIVLIIGIFYLSQMYHQRAAPSAGSITGATLLARITVGALLVNGIQELFFKNTVFAVDYPRVLFF